MAELIPFELAPRIADGPGSFSVVHAESRTEVAEIRRFRRLAYMQRSGLKIDDSIEVDERAHLFGLLDRGQIVACGRVLPLPDEAAGIHEFQHAALSTIEVPTEVGRVGVAVGRSPALLLAVLGLGARWMVDHTAHEAFVAYCSPRLVPMYRRVGACDLGIETTRPANGRPYRFVTGRFDVAAEQAMSVFAAMHSRRRSSRASVAGQLEQTA